MTTANANASFGYIQQRFNDLIGETSSSSASAAGQRHINATIQEIVGNFPFSWNITNTTLAISTYAATMPTNYYNGWPIEKCYIPATATSGEITFTQVPISEIDNYTTDDLSNPVYWIIYNATTDAYTLNSNITGVTVTIYYHYDIPTLSGLTDACPIPDPELVAYGAAAKNWIGDERNIELKREYQQTYDNGIKALWMADLANNAYIPVNGVASSQVNWRQ